MKSAKDTLAQYRLQGFSDELIELLAKEEEDQNFARDLLAALLPQNDQSETQAEEEAESTLASDIEDQTTDVKDSENLIKSAYDRIGINAEELNTASEFSEESPESTYIPPKLEVIPGGAQEDDPSIIPFLPEYALSPEEQEYAVTRSLAFFGEIEHEDEITPYYSASEETDILADEEWYVEEVEVAEIPADASDEVYAEVEVVEVPEAEIAGKSDDHFDCFDFDNIGRGSALSADTSVQEQEILDLDNSRPAEPEWQETSRHLITKFQELRDWAENIESDINHSSSEKKQLENELNNRNETLVLQGKEMEQLKTIHTGYINQLEQESKLLATAESRLNSYREESEHTEQMLLKFGDEIELLHGQLFTANDICRTQSNEIMEKDNTIRELNSSYRTLIARNEEQLTDARESQLAFDAESTRNNRIIQQLGREVEMLRSQLANASSARTGMTAEFCSLSEESAVLRQELSRLSAETASLHEQNQEFEATNLRQQRRIKRLEKVREKIKKLEFENNVYKTETVPNLQADKEDLVELASEEYNKAKSLDEIASKRARRMSYSTSLAAVACLLLVLMPVLSWNNIETEKSNIKSEYAMELASAQADNLKLEQNIASMQEELELLGNEYKTARESWNVQLSNLKQRNTAVSQEADIIQAAYSDPANETPMNVIAFDNNSIRDDLDAQSGFESEAQYNNVSGLDEFKNQLAQVTPNTAGFELLKGKDIHVRKGEGLSQVLWRVYRHSSPEMVSYISNLNKLPLDRRGNPMLKVDQKLILPKDVNTAMANSQSTPPRM